MPSSPPVAMISQSLAAKAFGDADPIGQMFRTGGRMWTVVGVTGDVATTASWETAPIVYLDHTQFADDRNWPLTYLVKSQLPPEELPPAGARSARRARSGAGAPPPTDDGAPSSRSTSRAIASSSS